jgi:hypothetical protein
MAKEGKEIEAQAALVTCHIGTVPVATRNDVILLLILGRSIGEGALACFTWLERPAFLFCLDLKVPVLGKVLGAAQTVFAGASSPITPAKTRRALPASAVFAAIEPNLSTEECCDCSITRSLLPFTFKAGYTTRLCTDCARIFA